MIHATASELMQFIPWLKHGRSLLLLRPDQAHPARQEVGFKLRGEPTDNLDVSESITVDGSATMELVYL
jgi:hypothetical protein